MAEITRIDVIRILASVPTAGCRKPYHLIRLAGVDLSGLDLSGLNLAHADLAGANLRGCNLTDANLAESDLSSADLTDAALRGVFAEGASFIDANLTRPICAAASATPFTAHIYGALTFKAQISPRPASAAQLAGARFCDANLTSADLSQAHIDADTRFQNAKLSGVIHDSIQWSNVPAGRRPVFDGAHMVITQSALQAVVTADLASPASHSQSSRAA